MTAAAVAARGGVEEAFNPDQARDRLGRWIGKDVQLKKGGHRYTVVGVSSAGKLQVAYAGFQTKDQHQHEVAPEDVHKVLPSSSTVTGGGGGKVAAKGGGSPTGDEALAAKIMDRIGNPRDLKKRILLPGGWKIEPFGSKSAVELIDPDGKRYRDTPKGVAKQYLAKRAKPQTQEAAEVAEVAVRELLEAERGTRARAILRMEDGEFAPKGAGRALAAGQTQRSRGTGGASAAKARGPAGSLDAVRKRHPGVELSTSERDGKVVLSMIKVADGARGKGAASAALRDLLAHADAHGKTVALTPEAVGKGGLSKSALTAWYRDHGFVPNKGRNKDWAFREAMVRRPRKVTEAAAVAEQQAHEVLEAPMDVGAIADRAVAAQAQRPPAATKQRGRSGTVRWDPSKHKRDATGRFAQGGGGPKAEAQRKLHRQGLYRGAIDAIKGPQTTAAIKAFQQKYGIKPTGTLDAETAAALQAPPPKTAAEVSADDAKAAADAAPKGRSARSGTQPKEGDPDFNWREHGNGKRGVVLGDGSRRVVDGAEFDRLSAAGQIDRAKTPRLLGDDATDTRGSSGGSSSRSSGDTRSGGGTARRVGRHDWQGELSPVGTLRQGDGTTTKGGKPSARGAKDVQHLQAKLEALGFDLGPAGPDGKFGPATKRAVKAFQRAYGLKPDGVVGRATKLILNLLGQAEGQPNVNALSIDQMSLSRPSRGGGRKGATAELGARGISEAAAAAALAVSAQLRS